MKKKALALLSGGLDSTLAIKCLMDQGIEITALNFMTPFCTCTSKTSGCKHQATQIANELGVKIDVRFKGMEYIDIIKNPKYGYGKNMNPCVDCRIFMHKAAKELMEEIGASFLVTGEVVGQRPMSQRRDTLKIIERDSGLVGLVLRPLSAKILDPTIPELKGIVDRNALLAISGRSRKSQLDLARKWQIEGVLCGGSGCLLTDYNFANKLRDLFENEPDYTLTDIRFLRVGRHFRLNDKVKVILGRNAAENERLLELAGGPYYYLFRPTNFNGPVAVAKKRDDLDLKSIRNTIGQLIMSFSNVTSDLGEKFVNIRINGHQEAYSIKDGDKDLFIEKRL